MVPEIGPRFSLILRYLISSAHSREEIRIKVKGLTSPNP
jgi:hypothetical protein